jgi:hypothetical protein
MRCAGQTSALVVAAAFLLAPFSYWQLSSVGLTVIGSAAVTVISAVSISHAAQCYFASAGSPLTGLLVAMCTRMLLPLVFVVAIAVLGNPRVPAWTAMYIAPLYAVMLIAETAFALRRCRVDQTANNVRSSTLPQAAEHEG